MISAIQAPGSYAVAGGFLLLSGRSRGPETTSVRGLIGGMAGMRIENRKGTDFGSGTFYWYNCIKIGVEVCANNQEKHT